MPDRLPSLVLLAGFWVPAAIAGGAAAEFVHRNTTRVRPATVYAALAAFVLASTAIWFYINRSAMPPYLPGTTMDPTYAPPEAVATLAVVASALVLPGSAIACVLAFRSRRRALRPMARA